MFTLANVIVIAVFTASGFAFGMIVSESLLYRAFKISRSLRLALLRSFKRRYREDWEDVSEETSREYRFK